DFPDLADRVADELRSQRMSIRVASETMHIGERAELLRWRSLCDTMFSTMIGATGADDEP
ncbi:MAG TPA: protein mobD, partial [Paraburkholderia sp.]|nr:protein mobD [Paraburkholderia sp.]